jgi:nondiscriminating glutamyl-tRNA synthetase
MFNYLALLSWSPEGEKELLSKEEIIEQFRLDRVTRANPVFDINKLNWINAHYIKESPPERIVELAKPYLVKEGFLTPHQAEERQEWLTLMVSTVQERLTKVSDITSLARMFFDDQIAPENDEALMVLKEEGVGGLLQALKSAVEKVGEVDHHFCSGIFKALQKETGLKGKKLFMPVRVAVTGQCHGPELDKTFLLLGKEKLLARLEHVLNNYV